jgi:homoserine dehydrogenase
VLGDLIDAAVNLRKGAHATLGAFAKARVRPIDEPARVLRALEVADRPGVLHAVTGVFAATTCHPPPEQEGLGDDARLVFITHDAPRRPTCRPRCGTCASSTW